MKRKIVLLLLCGLTRWTLAQTNNMEIEKAFGMNPQVLEQNIQVLEKKEAKNSSDYFNLGVAYLASSVAPKPVLHRGKKAVKALLQSQESLIQTLYLGMAYSLAARDNPNPVVKIMQMDKAFHLLDRAVQKAEKKHSPRLWYYHFIRGNVYANLPGFFHKSEIAYKDYLKVLQAYKNKTSIPLSMMITVYFGSGEFLKTQGKIDQAVDFWKKAATLNEVNQLNNLDGIAARKRLILFDE